MNWVLPSKFHFLLVDVDPIGWFFVQVAIVNAFTVLTSFLSNLIFFLQKSTAAVKKNRTYDFDLFGIFYGVIYYGIFVQSCISLNYTISSL